MWRASSGGRRGRAGCRGGATGRRLYGLDLRNRPAAGACLPGMRLIKAAVVCLLNVSAVFAASGGAPARPAAAVRLVTDEAEAVLAILDKRKSGRPIDEADWSRVFSSEGYVRLKRRETAMKRTFEDADFKTFVLSDALAGRAQALRETLDRWKRADVGGAVRLALAYLPARARVRAKIYPVIKPRDNSFVFDVETDPAIFLYLDPAMSKEKFVNHLAHELHHIGYGGRCPTGRTAQAIAGLPTEAQAVMTWVRAFGEGFAVLAAAGGPDTHPHAVSDPEERARWDADVANFNADLKKVEGFFLDVLEKRLTGDAVASSAFAFYGVQGPWYTVGWKMSALIEKTYGRRKLIECMCDQRKLLQTYNRAASRHNRRAREPLALWSAPLLKSVGGPTRPAAR
jgi:Putative zinc dependent peptidase (DUF5700)